MKRADEIARNLSQVQQSIKAAALKYDRNLDDLTLIAVTKTFPNKSTFSIFFIDIFFIVIT